MSSDKASMQLFDPERKQLRLPAWKGFHPSRSGQLLGMISTHWREPHQPAERELLRLDVLARQAADLIERGKAEAALRESNDQLLWLLPLSKTVMTQS